MSTLPEVEDCVTMTQFNELRQSIEQKKDKLSQDLQALMDQLRIQNSNLDGASNQENEVDETDEEAAARIARQQQQRQE
jgi:hypothetical protein